MKQKVTLMLLATFLCCVLGVQAQTGSQVTGKVVDAMGELPGVSVVVKGTTNGTVTGLDGSFKLDNVKPADIVQFSFIGYKTQEIKVGSQKIFNITLQEDAQALGEVVITAGYGDIKRKDFTGSAGKANMVDMMKAPIASFDQALAGRIAGVQVSSNEGMPGSTFNIVVRGNNSLTQSNSPLYVIDGFPVEDANAASINPADIESLDILKDASATAIYGARGANGVVIITTKKGTAGKATVTYNGSFSVQKIINTIDMMDAYEFVKLQGEVRSKAEMESTWFSNYPWKDDNGVKRDLEFYRNLPTDVKQYDWQDKIFRSALTHNHYASLNGGKEGTRYSASLSYPLAELK